MRRSLALLALCAFALSACARNMSSDVYSSSTSVGKVAYGTIVSARPVTIKDNDQISKNGTGVLAGGAAGAALGSTMGGGSGRTVSTVGGAIAGAVAGALVQDQLATQDGTEYIVRLDGGKASSTARKTKVSVRGQGEVTSDVNGGTQIESSETDTISVIQDNSVMFSRGQRVMVVYRDDRTRLEPAQ